MMKKIHHKIKKHYLRIIDSMIYGVGTLSVVANFPQIITIWVRKNISGVSLISWSGFLLCSVIWLVYGLSHKDKPIIFMNGLLLVVQSAVVVGILIH